MDDPFGGWRSSRCGDSIDSYAPRDAQMIGLEIALVGLTIVLFAVFDAFVRACDRL
jgi:hypothetical protein